MVSLLVVSWFAVSLLRSVVVDSFIVGQIVPLISLYYKMNKFFFATSLVNPVIFCLRVAVMMIHPQSHHIHLIVRIAAKQAIMRVHTLCQKCNNSIDDDVAEVHPSKCRNPSQRSAIKCCMQFFYLAPTKKGYNVPDEHK